MGERIAKEKHIYKNPFVVSLHRPNYFLGITYNDQPNRELYKSVGRMEFIAERGNFFAGLKSWYRIPEAEEEDDNPDIEDYIGYGQLFGGYKYKKSVRYSLPNILPAAGANFKSHSYHLISTVSSQ